LFLKNKNKTPKFFVPTNIRLKNDIDSVKKLNELKKWLISRCLAFVQIWQLQGYGQYNIRGNIINVPSNINYTQSILFHFPHDKTIISLLLKRQMKYKSPYLTNNVCLNFIMLALPDILNTPLYEKFGIIIHSHWFDIVATLTLGSQPKQRCEPKGKPRNHISCS
jgi:hypothetical protein